MKALLMRLISSLLLRRNSVCILFLLLIIYTFTANGQAPQGIAYQAIARDAAGNPLINTPLQVKLAVMSDSIGSSILWEELFNPVTTNPYGMLTVTMGQGTRQGTSLASTFSDVNWSNWPLFVRTQIYYQSTWKNMGSTRLWSVPYALNANSITGSQSYLNVKGNTSQMDSALFVVRNTNGQIVFAVYNEGVRIYVDDGAKGTAKGGFAIGGFGTSKGTSQPYFIVNSDSIRGYIGTNPLKGVKGGFAIGGFGTSKTAVEEYLRVTRDSTRIYLNNTGTKSVKGGFAIGGFGTSKGKIQDFFKVSKDSTNIKTTSAGSFTVANYETGAQGKYLNLTPDNYFIGQLAGNSITYGRYNFFLGYKAGFSTTGVWPVGRNEGSYNSFIGYQAGYSNTVGMFNLFLGYQAGYSNIGSTYWSGNYNSFLGYKSGYTNSTGYGNCYMGYNSGSLNSTGSFSVAIGYEAGYNNNASNNVFIGTSTGYYNTTGTSNVAVGSQAGWHNTTGNYNIYLGTVAGDNTTTGSHNIYIGDHSAYNLITSSSNVFLGYATGMNSTSGSQNIFVGEYSGANYDSGNNNLFMGYMAGYGGATGDAGGSGENIFLGTWSGYNITTGSGNICLGTSSGNALTTASDNIFIGRNSGKFETASNNLCIDIKSRTDLADQKAKALLYGNFDALPANQYIRINAHVGVNSAGSASYAMYVTGNGYITGTWTSASDSRFKRSVQPLESSLSKVLELNPVTYSWKQNEFPAMHFDSESHIGVIAQELEKIFPQLVVTDDKGYKSVAYDKISVILIGAIKEQQKIIEDQQLRLSRLEKLESRIEELEKLLSSSSTSNN